MWGRVEHYSVNDSSDIWGGTIYKANIFIFQIAFSQWRAGLIKNYFEMFFYDWPLLSSWKISGLSVQLFTFCQKKCQIFYHICVNNIFLPKYLRFYTSQKNYQIGIRNEQKLGLYFSKLLKSLMLWIAT